MLDKKSLIERVQSFANYPQNWDGMGAEPPTPTAITDAERVIKLLPDNIARPHVSLAADGEINLLWQLPGFKLSVSVFGDGGYWFSSESEHEVDADWTDEPIPCCEPLNDILVHRLVTATAEATIERS